MATQNFKFFNFEFSIRSNLRLLQLTVTDFEVKKTSPKLELMLLRILHVTRIFIIDSYLKCIACLIIISCESLSFYIDISDFSLQGRPLAYFMVAYRILGIIMKNHAFTAAIRIVHRFAAVKKIGVPDQDVPFFG